MRDFEMNDHILQTECIDLAREIFDEFKSNAGADFDPEDYRDEMRDRAHEAADGHEWVIYTYKARMLCAHCDVSEGEAFLEDVGAPENPTYDSLATMIADGEMHYRIGAELERLIEGYDPEDEEVGE